MVGSSRELFLSVSVVLPRANERTKRETTSERCWEMTNKSRFILEGSNLTPSSASVPSLRSRDNARNVLSDPLQRLRSFAFSFATIVRGSIHGEEGQLDPVLTMSLPRCRSDDGFLATFERF